MQVLCALAVFRVYVPRILRVLAVFRGPAPRILPDSQYFGDRYCGYSLYFQVFRGSVQRVLQVLAVFRALVLLIQRVLAAPIYSICPVYSRYEVYFDHLCNCCVDNFMPIALQKTFPDGPTSEPEQIRWERSWSTYRVLAVNRDYMLRVLVCRESVLRRYCLSS